MAESKAGPAPGMSRRALFRAGGLTAAAMGLSGCSVLADTAGVGNNPRVGVAWSAGELKAFRAVLANYPKDCELVPLGDDIASALGARTAGRPDLVAMPQPGTVKASIDLLQPVPDDLPRSRYGWIPLDADVQRYAVPFKLAHASVVWYRKRLFDEHDLLPPGTWNDWLKLNQRIIDDPELSEAGVAPLALGGADGWLLAVSFENVLLRHFSATYGMLSEPSYDPGLWEGPEVKKALGMIAEMWAVAGAVSGGLDRALVLQFPDAVQEVFRYRRAAMVVAPDYAESVIRRFGTPQDEVGTFTFPADGGTTAPLAVAGDLLVVAKGAREGTDELLRYLAGPRAPVPWIRDTGGFIAANPYTDTGYYSPVLRRLAGELHLQQVRFRLADQLGAVGGAAGLGLVLQQLVRTLAAGKPASTAAREAARKMVSIAAAAR